MTLTIFFLLALALVAGAWIVGPTYGQDQAPGPATGRQSKEGSAVIAQQGGKYGESASRGLIFCAGDQGAGVTVQTSITTTAALTLANPAQSNKRLEILKVSIAYFSGTLGAGAFYHGATPYGKAAPAGGTALTATCTDLGNNAAVAAVGVASSGATVVAGTVLWPFASSFPELASTANALQQILEDVDGSIYVEPGGSYQLLSVMGGAGSSPKISVGIVWREVPYAGAVG